MPIFDRAHTDDLLSFLAASPTPYHAVANAAARLEAAGFRQLRQAAAWDRAEGGGFYVIRGAAIIAWYLPAGAPAHAGFRVVGAHTDSPNLRVKPLPDTGSAGFRQVAVELYGGPLLNSWLDRDLGLAGRLVLRGGDATLVHVDRALMRVPQLAVHLDRGVNDNGLLLDKQQHLTPAWGLGPIEDGALLEFAAKEAGVSAADVLGYDLMLHDVTPPTYLGRDFELIAAPRMDNLVSVHAGVQALVAAAGAAAAGDPLSAIPVLAAFDHEEAGSESDTGAGGPLLGNVLSRVAQAQLGGSTDDYARALAATVVMSSDMSHAVHPNYPERHEPGHRPRLNGGPALKTNVNQRYATDGLGRAIWTDVCERAGIPTQYFVGKNSMPCGTTIGPITAAKLGVTTFDVGITSLSMHSAREMGGADDPHLLASAAAAFFAG
ncbi:M18 family aminopeptidase [Catenulispora pinisilvae]|uniref:M18 family aminopeptidase n=1 Tax=Catenulispora pinisilvae TaxID=2705253 RepID=UPI0018914116|nr:M18 family aminopeptidase [Catenulispora pinisilvae]